MCYGMQLLPRHCIYMLHIYLFDVCHVSVLQHGWFVRAGYPCECRQFMLKAYEKIVQVSSLFDCYPLALP